MAKPQSNLLSALAAAIEAGYIHNIYLTKDGQLMSASGEIHSEIIEIVPCLSCGATLYLTAGETTKGNWVDFWDI